MRPTSGCATVVHRSSKQSSMKLSTSSSRYDPFGEVTTVIQGAQVGTAARSSSISRSPPALNMTSTGGIMRARAVLDVVVVCNVHRSRICAWPSFRGTTPPPRMPNEDISFTDLVRGEISFKAGSVPDFVVARAKMYD